MLFFVALEHAYDLFYRDLNVLNRKPFLHVAHTKKPTKNEYIEKVRKIRNIAIAHLGSEEGEQIDAIAAMMWQPMTWSASHDKPWDVDEITFGEGQLHWYDAGSNIVSQSSDFEIKGIPQLHSYCTEYLDEYDRVCADYLTQIRAKLPITIDGVTYE